MRRIREIRSIGKRKSTGDMVVAIEGEILKAGGDAIPSGHVGGFGAADAGTGGNHDVSVAERPAYEDDVQLNLSPHDQRFRAEEKYTGGADITSDQRDAILLVHTANAS